MTRRRVGAHLEKVVDQTTGQEGEIRFDKGDLTFHAFGPAEANFSGKDGTAVRAWLRAELAKVTDVAWTPVIEVTYDAPKYDQEWAGGSYRKKRGTERWEDDEPGDDDEPTGGRVHIKLNVQRYYLAQMAGGKHRWLNWDSYHAAGGNAGAMLRDSQEYRELGSQGMKLPHWWKRSGYDGEQRVLVAYDENLWLGLSTMVSLLKGARQRVFDLLEESKTFEPVALAGERIAQRLLPSVAESAV